MPVREEKESGISVLLVEDEERVCAFVQNRLTSLGYTISSVASCGEEAVRAAEFYSPDLVLMDIRLAGKMDGVTAAGAIRRRCDIPVVYMTGHSDEETLARAKETNPVGYVTKPFSTDTLKSAIEIGLSRHRAERHLRENGQWLRTMLNSIADAVVAADPAGKVMFMNPAAERLCGWSMEDARGEAIEDVLHLVSRNDGRRLPSPIDEVLETGRKRCIGGHTLISRNGRRREIEDSVAPIRDDGEIIGAILIFQDVTEKVRAEEELNQYRHRLDLIVNSSEDVFVLHDPDGRYLFYRGPERYGMTDEKILGKSPADLFPPEQAGPILQQIRYVVETGQQIRAENRVDWRGETIWFSEVVYPVRNRAEKIIAVGKICRNITDQKLAENDLIASEQRFRMYFEQAPLGYQSLDENGCVLEVNPKWLELMGYEREEVLGRWWGNFLAPGYAEVFRERFERFKAEGAVRDVTFEMVAKDGRIITAGFDGVIARDEAGQFLQTHCVLRDITAQQQAEEALRSTNEVFMSLFNSSPLAIFSTDIEGRIVLWNPTAERLLGWSADEAINQPAPMVPDGMDEFFRDWIRAVFAGGSFISRELDVVTAGGEILPVSLSMAPIRSAEGTVIGAMGMLQDLSDRKRAEQSRDRLEERLHEVRRMETLGLLAGGIAHDYNNLLMTIIGNVDLAMLEAIPETHLAEDLEEIRRAALKASDLTSQLLAYAGKGALLMAKLDLADLVRKVRPRLTGCLGGCELSLDIPDRPMEIRGDFNQLQRVLENLVTNAAEALGGDGADVTVKAAERIISAGELAEASGATMDAGVGIVLEVIDEGPGMSESTLAKVFDPFFSTRFTGRGMGLPAVLGVMRAHSGRIGIDSELGRGTRVSLYFPRAGDVAGQPRELTAGPDQTEFRASGTVLVADDDESVRRVAQRLLTHFGLDVLLAANGQDAIDQASRRAEQIDLYLLDVVMPKVGGIDAFEEIRHRDPSARIALMSGYAEPESIHSLQQRGLVGFIQKPFVQNQLLGVLRKAFTSP
ncbi:MAG: PAS domain S-box protein [Planctomycetota bacterium]